MKGKSLKIVIKHLLFSDDQTPENDMKNSNNDSNEQSSYQCNVCGKKLSTIKKLQKHQLKVHGGKNPETYENQTPVCQEQSPGIYDLTNSEKNQSYITEEMDIPIIQEINLNEYHLRNIQVVFQPPPDQEDQFLDEAIEKTNPILEEKEPDTNSFMMG